MCLVQRVDEFAEDHNNETFLRGAWFRELMNLLRIIIIKHFSEVPSLKS